MNGGVMMKVYVITEGEYSGYGIVTVFSTEELANKFVEMYPDTRIEEYILDYYEQRVRDGKKPYNVWMFRDGTTQHCNETMNEPRGIEFHKVGLNGNIVVDVTVFAKDEQHAVKIVNEKRAQLIASGEWDEFEKAHKSRIGE
jgi:hypothetical protein